MNADPSTPPVWFPHAVFDIVAIAASAGGLDAIGTVLAGLPSDFPAAVVVLLHLDPNHRSLLPDVLARYTKLKVRRAEHGDSLQPSTVYVVPPNHRLLVNGGKRSDDPIRGWSAGCSSGEEAYTLAIVLAEALGPEAFRERVKVYATDVDEDALNKARQGIYTAKEIDGVDAALREKYFDHIGDRYGENKEVRRAVIFGRHDLVQDALYPALV